MFDSVFLGTDFGRFTISSFFGGRESKFSYDINLRGGSPVPEAPDPGDPGGRRPPRKAGFPNFVPRPVGPGAQPRFAHLLGLVAATPPHNTEAEETI